MDQIVLLQTPLLLAYFQALHWAWMKPGGREQEGELTPTICQIFYLNNYTYSHWLDICYVLGTLRNFYPLTITDTNEADHISPIYSF